MSHDTVDFLPEQQKHTRPKRLCLWAILIAVLLLAAGLFAVWRQLSYPVLFRRQLDSIFGEGRWHCTNNTVEFYHIPDTNVFWYRQWEIEYFDGYENIRHFTFNDVLYRANNGAIDRQEDFDMSLENLALEQSEGGLWGDLNRHGYQQEVEEAGPCYVYITLVPIDYDGELLSEFDATAATTPGGFTPLDYLQTGNYYIAAGIGVWNPQYLAEAEESATRLNRALLAAYGKNANFQISVSCDYEGQSESTLPFMCMNGKPVGNDDNRYRDLADYLFQHGLGPEITYE